MQALSNRPNADVEIRISLKEDTAHFECSGNGSQVRIFTQSSKETVQGTFTLSYEGILRLGFKVLGSPEIKQLYPHAALPEGVSESPTNSKRMEIIKQAKEGYREEFGEPDHFGLKAMLRPIDSAGVKWGDTLEVRGVPKGTQTFYQVTATGEISLAAMVDVFIAFVKDSRTMAACPNFSIPYMRRWGEEAFVDGQLKEGIPTVLTKDVHLKTPQAKASPLKPVEVPLTPSLDEETIAPPVVAVSTPSHKPAAQAVVTVVDESVVNARVAAALVEERAANATESARLEALRVELEQRADSLDRLQATVELKQQELDLRKSNLDAAQTHLKTFESHLNNRRDALKGQEDHFSRRNDGLVAKAERIDARERAVELRELRAASVPVKSAAPQPNGDLKAVQERSASLNNQEDAIRRNRLGLEARENDLKTRTETFERQMTLRETALTTRQAQLDKSIEELALAQNSLAAARSQLDTEIETLAERSAAQRKEIDEKVAEANGGAIQALADREEELQLLALELQEARETFERERTAWERDLAVQREHLDAEYAKITLVEQRIGERLKAVILPSES